MFMEQKIQNKLKDITIEGNYIGGDQYTILLYREEERKFVVTHHANIKPVYYFTGRETELNDLRQKIESKQKSVLVSGMGGIGKTHICRKLFGEYEMMGRSGSFQYIGYIEYNGDIGSSLQECLHYKKQERLEANQEAAWKELEYLASDGKLLLFIDNVNKTIKEDPGLERLNGIPGAIILTSRRTSFQKEFEPYRIGFLSMEQCKEIYKKIRFENSVKKITLEKTADLEYIIEKLAARHTITVEFLAHLAKTKSWSTERLRRELEEKGFLLEYRDEEDELVNIQKSYETLYDMSGLTEAEQNILEAFSIFPYIPLSAEICNQWLLEDAGANEEDDIIMGLYRKGWLQFDIEQESYALHPVFALFIYKKCRPVLEKHQGLIESCKMSLQIPKSGSAVKCQKYIPFVENMIEKIEMREEMKKAGLMAGLAYLLQYIAEYKRAEKLYEKILRIKVEILGEKHPDTIVSSNDLAEIYETQGEYKKAKELYKKNLQIIRKMLIENHLNEIEQCNGLTEIYEKHGEYKTAEESFWKSLFYIVEKMPEEKYLYTVTSYNLVEMYDKWRNYKKVEELFWKNLLYVMKHIVGEESLSIAEVYHNLARVYERQREYRKAEKLYRKSLRIIKRKLGEEHLSIVESYRNLARVYERQEECKKAEELYEKSLWIMEKILGEEHPYTAISYDNLARVYEKQEKYRKAEELYEKSLLIREKVWGNKHLYTAISYGNLARIYHKQGKYKKAEELYKKSLLVRKKLLGEKYSSTAKSYYNLAGVYQEQGKYKKAEELYEKSLWIMEKILGKKHVSTAKSYHNLAGVYFSQKNYKCALEYFVKAYMIFINNLGSKHPYTKISCKNMKITYARWNPDGSFEQWLKEQMEKLEYD